MRLQRRSSARSTRPACTLCLDTGRVPYVGNHFDLWMVPCHACTGHARDTGRSRALTTTGSPTGS